MKINKGQKCLNFLVFFAGHLNKGICLIHSKVIPQLNPFWYINWSVPGYFWQEDQWLVTSLKTPNCLGHSLSQWLNLNLADCSILDGLRNGIELVGKVVYGFVEGIQFCVGPFATSARRCLIFWALKRMIYVSRTITSTIRESHVKSMVNAIRVDMELYLPN